MKERFSDRIGKTKPSEALQIDGMSSELRNSLWNLLIMTFKRYHDKETSKMVEVLCVFFFRERLDDLPRETWDKLDWLKARFFHPDFNWYEVYNLFDYIIGNWNNIPFSKPLIRFIIQFNEVMEEENSGFRIVNGIISRIINEAEINSIENSILNSEEKGLKGISIHLDKANKYLSMKPDPDFANSIKESISAVESLVKQLTNEKGGGLDKALIILDNKVKFHGSFKSALSSLYGYTSDESGIRHPILEEKDIGFDEAKYMLVSCSAFVNFIIAKAEKVGLLN